MTNSNLKFHTKNTYIAYTFETLVIPGHIKLLANLQKKENKMKKIFIGSLVLNVVCVVKMLLKPRAP